MKLMGRSSGFIAMHASLSRGQIDIGLIPEVCSDHLSLLIIFIVMIELFPSEGTG